MSIDLLSGWGRQENSVESPTLIELKVLIDNNNNQKDRNTTWKYNKYENYKNTTWNYSKYQFKNRKSVAIDLLSGRARQEKSLKSFPFFCRKELDNKKIQAKNATNRKSENTEWPLTCCQARRELGRRHPASPCSTSSFKKTTAHIVNSSQGAKFGTKSN